MIRSYYAGDFNYWMDDYKYHWFLVPPPYTQRDHLGYVERAVFTNSKAELEYWKKRWSLGKVQYAGSSHPPKYEIWKLKRMQKEVAYRKGGILKRICNRCKQYVGLGGHCQPYSNTDEEIRDCKKYDPYKKED